MARPKQRARSKYGAKRITIDGVTFASTAEGRRYEELKRQERKGHIRDLKLQPRFKINHPITGKTICTYVGDFQYERDGETIVEDVKGVLTTTYRLKKKLMRMFNEIEIVEVKSVRVGKGVYAWSVGGMIEEV